MIECEAGYIQNAGPCYMCGARQDQSCRRSPPDPRDEQIKNLRADIARHVQIAAEQAGEIERLTEALQIVAAPLKINGDDHAAAVKHARAALAAKGE